MLDTATQNPDSNQYMCPPDGVTGSSTIARQKIVRTIANTGIAYDYWIVQWDHEPTEGSTCTAAWLCATAVEDTTSGIPTGALSQVQDIAGGWSAAGYSSSLTTGGLCIYQMKPGTSPFPSADPTVLGPVEPVSTTQLLYRPDVLHDLARIVGSNWELVDTTNALNQQGNCYQGAWDANQENIDSYQLYSTLAATQLFSPLNARTASCPPGTSEELVKVPHNRIAAAKQGTFVMNRIDMLNNKPTGGYGILQLYESTTQHPLMGGRRIFLALSNQNVFNSADAGATWHVSVNATQQGKIYKTAVQMNCTVLTALSSTNYSASVSREITVQCFTGPTSFYLPYSRAMQCPTDYAVLSALQNTMDSLPPFSPSKANAGGGFAKMAKGIWKKVAPIVKPVVGVVGRELLGAAPASVQSVFSAATDVMNDINKAKMPANELQDRDLLKYVVNRAAKGAAQRFVPPQTEEALPQRKTTQGKRRTKAKKQAKLASEIL